MTPFCGWGSTASRPQSHYEKAVYFLTLSSQIFLVLISLTSEVLKSELTLEPQNGFGHSIPGLGIQYLQNPASINMTEPLVFVSS